MPPIRALGMKSVSPLNSKRGPLSTSSPSMPLFDAGEIAGYSSICPSFQVISSCGWPCATSFNGQPTPISDDEIDALHRSLTEQFRAEPHSYLTVGRRVRVASGPLAGLEGIIVRKKNHSRIVISLHLIMRSVSVDISDAQLMPVGGRF